MSFRLRLTPLDGPELCCPHCGEWWAITLEQLAWSNRADKKPEQLRW